MGSNIERVTELLRMQASSAIPPDIEPKQLVDSANRAKARGLRTAAYQRLGPLISMYRQACGFSVDDLSLCTGVSSEDIIDLEVANLNIPQAVAVAERLRPTLGIDDQTFRDTLLSSPIRR